jgi:hypothetical protein
MSSSVQVAAADVRAARKWWLPKIRQRCRGAAVVEQQDRESQRNSCSVQEAAADERQRAGGSCR